MSMQTRIQDFAGQYHHKNANDMLQSRIPTHNEYRNCCGLITHLSNIEQPMISLKEFLFLQRVIQIRRRTI